MEEHSFTGKIRTILQNNFGVKSEEIFERSLLIQYLNLKTRSANKGSKSRGSFASLYAIYVIVEDYLSKKFDKKGDYTKYEGAEFSKLFQRQRELAFGSKLQNHALNNRMNSEFQKFFPTSEYIPILRKVETNRYWINENLLKVKTSKKTYNIAKSIIQIINEYAKTKRDAFEKFIESCEKLQKVETQKPRDVQDFIFGLLAPNVDARLFEIVSYAILKYFYYGQIVIWGFKHNKLNKENLKLFKTGRTNANDGGIDFVMKPLGRFFQVTETLNVKKYFLDIDKIERFPITFVIKSEEKAEVLLQKLEENARRWYSVQAIVKKYLDCIEEIINIPILKDRFIATVKRGQLPGIFSEIIRQSKVEFNYEEDDDGGGEE